MNCMLFYWLYVLAKFDSKRELTENPLICFKISLKISICERDLIE